MATATGKTVLIVDDDYELSDGIRAVLENLGHRVIQARDGIQGTFEIEAALDGKVTVSQKEFD